MKNKAPLALMEQLIMILVFALAAALCLQAFSSADRTSRESTARDMAIIEAQNAAEALKHCRGDYEDAAALYGGVWDGQIWTISSPTGTLQVFPEHSESDLLGRARAQMTAEDGTLLFSLPIAWQKEGTSHG